MARYDVISADSHVAEPGDLWQNYMESPLRQRAPHVRTEADTDVFVCEGLDDFNVGLLAPAGTDPKKLSRKGRYADSRKGGWDPDERLKDMATDGVDAEVIYPTLAMRMYKVADVEFQDALFRAYNSWLSDFCNAYPDRLKGIAVVSLDDIERGMAETRRAAALGLRGVMVSSTPQEHELYTDLRYDPFWSLCQELDLPVSLHLFTGSKAHTTIDHWLVEYTVSPHWVQQSVAALIFGGVFVRFPRLKVISVENDIGWAGTFLERIDHAYERHRHWSSTSAGLTRRPSDYFHDHVYLTFMRDHTGIEIRHRIGLDNIMWSNDYPHTDSIWPHSREVIVSLFEGVPEAEKRRIVCDNAAELYHFA
ncbi:MAG: amidohydrolase [Chloroflexi bacterium]|nr:amidohydrolase [Chloroflexota bacterium]MCH8196104.1 amidohydrolase [Chloroflexota bacterium]MCH8284511.1 amidohydrolase [Chloroflexota bacterium]